MTYQIRPLFHQILHTLGKPLSHYDPHFPIQIKTLTAVNRLQPPRNTFIGMAILPGRINVLLRPKVFVVETTAIVEDIPVTTYNVVVMDAAGDLRLVEDITASSNDLDGLSRFILQAADLLDEQAGRNHPQPPLSTNTRNALCAAARHIAREPKPRWVAWVTYILEELEDHNDSDDYANMLTELSLAIEARQLEGSW